MRLKKVLFASFLAIFLFLAGTVGLRAQSCGSDLNCLNNLINQYQNEINRLRGQANTLSNQIAQFNAQIKLTELKINQTEEKITLLGGRIDQLQVSLTNLNNAFFSRAVETYKIARFSSSLNLVLTAGDFGDIFSRFHYLRKIQDADRGLLARLTQAQNTYKEEKTDQEVLQEELEKQKQVLGAQKTAKDNLLASTRGEEARYQQLLSQAKAQLAAFSRFAASQGGASILENQTKCDGWGCYYNQRDSQWGNIGLGGSSYSVAEYGCLVTSVSMLASHYGKSLKPSDIAVNPNYFIPGTGYLWWSADGMPFSLTSVSKDELDSRLNNGPIIAGLYYGPAHFIVILRKEGDNYIMHDPFMPDGGNRPLTDKYSVSDITSLRAVTFY
jgi:peptidoglycan hydrolase CwlO-like protein